MAAIKQVEVSCTVKRETSLALLVFDGEREVWVPKSQITDYGEDRQGNTTSIFIPEWLAEEKDLV